MKNPALHIYNRLAYGPRPENLEGPAPDLQEYLERQLRPEAIPDPAVERALEGFETLGQSGVEILESAPDRMDQRRAVLELTQAKLVRAISSERQLQEVMVDFWFNHFNVFSGKGVCRVLVSSYEREAIRPYVFGRFRDLVQATARHPAMLFYLDNWLSAAPNARARGLRAAGRRQGLNENYARELMELHTLGVDGGYTQEDVVGVARAFTGWTIEGPRRPVFRFAPALHDTGPKRVLGQSVSGSGMAEGEAIIDQLAAHPATARFISTKLAVRFVSDDPPPALVARAARRFSATGGDIREVLRTLVLSEEFEASESQKVKTPLEFVVSAFRRIGAEAPDAASTASPAPTRREPESPQAQAPRAMDTVQGMSDELPNASLANLAARALTQLGQRPYGAVPPTGYPDTAADWMSSGALMARLNLVTQLGSGRVRRLAPGRAPDGAGIIRTLGSADFQRK